MRRSIAVFIAGFFTAAALAAVPVAQAYSLGTVWLGAGGQINVEAGYGENPCTAKRLGITKLHGGKTVVVYCPLAK